MAKPKLLNEILKFFAKTAWPWFKDYIWPILREHIIEIMTWIFATLKEKIKDSVNKRLSAREQEAKQKAEQAEENAQNARDDAERKSYEAVAQVWREVAEQFREENEALKSKLQELTSVAEAEIAQRARGSDPNVDTSSEIPVLMLGDKRITLPALPSDSNS